MIIDYEALDPGIRQAVKVLNDYGFETCDSGDGYSKEPEAREFGPGRHVISTTVWWKLFYDANRLQEILDRERPENVDWVIEGSYNPKDKKTFLICREALPGEL
jgi:hypothetical protein